jgi:SAM-dependent methyltransferase
MDPTTRKVSEMYSKYPYPSSRPHGLKLKELANLLKLFCLETGYSLDGKSVLDAGTGTGHRLIEAAAAFPNTQFTAVDISETPLAIARQTAGHEGVRNVDFHLANLMEGDCMLDALPAFDVILSMGVIHHLSDPAAGIRNLVRKLAGDGILFLYIYGKHGGRERMRRKRIVSLLLNGDGQNLEHGIGLVKELGFDASEYGWNLNLEPNPEDEETRNSLIVDAYLNVNETLFDIDGIFDLMCPSGLHAFLTYGLTLENHGCLFDTRLAKGPREMFVTTNIAAHLPSQPARDAYEALTLKDKYRLADLFFEPNGYTLMAFKPASLRHFPPEGRILANLVTH